MNFLEKLALMPILMDVVEEMAKESLRKECITPTCSCCNTAHQVPCREERPASLASKFVYPSQPTSSREPDGVDIHVDRPRQENYWSRQQWAKDMANYRCLIDQAKKCDWPSKEPMKGIPHYASQIQRDWYDENPTCW